MRVNPTIVTFDNDMMKQKLSNHCSWETQWIDLGQ